MTPAANAPLQGRISSRFAGLAASGRTGFIPYLTAGYPNLDSSRELLAGLAEAGADVIELGIPFSDPMADGPTIQRSSQGALEQGTTVDDVIALLQEFRRGSDVPVVLFTYLNPVCAVGVGEFLGRAQDAGADGLLATDLPLGADPDIEAQICESPLDLVRLIAPTTPPTRAAEIANASQGFVYYVARTGVTGARQELRGALRQELAQLREMAELPVAVGFGVSTAAQARRLAAFTDAVVVGSALVDRLDESGVAGALALAQEIREALDEGG